MRIGVNCFLLQRKMGGLRQYFVRLFRELLANDGENDYVFFYFENNIEELAELGNDRWKDHAILLQQQEDVERFLDRIDLYFCPFGAIWPRPVPVPSVVTLVDAQEKFYPEFFTPVDLWNREFHYDASTRAADQVITISEFSRESIAFHHRISRDKIVVAYLAAEDGFYDPDWSRGVSVEGLPDRYIYYPANRWPHKNHDKLLRALAVLRDIHSLVVPCVLTGFDYEGGYPLGERAAELGVAEQLVVPGYVGPREVHHIYRNAEMLCFPSLFEGFGMPLVEAMASGCPVVCADATSIPEVVGDAGLLFDPLDPEDIAAAIKRVWTDGNLREDLRARGRERAKNFSVKALAEAHKEAFRKAEERYRGLRYLFFRYLAEPWHRYRLMLKKPQT